MLSKNNKPEMLKSLKMKKTRFALRKLTIGCASVLIGLTFYGVGQTAHAATVDSMTSPQTTVTATQSTNQDQNNEATADFPKVGDPDNDQGLPNVGARQEAYSSEIIHVYNPGSSDVHQVNGGWTYNHNDGDTSRVIAVQNMHRANTNTDDWSTASFEQVPVDSLNLPAHQGYDVRIDVAEVRTPNDTYNYGLTEAQTSAYRDRLIAELKQQLTNNDYKYLPAVDTTMPVDIVYSIYFVPASQPAPADPGKKDPEQPTPTNPGEDPTQPTPTVQQPSGQQPALATDGNRQPTSTPTTKNQTQPTPAVQSAAVKAVKSEQQSLPQTGNATNTAAVAGLGLIGLTTLFGLGSKRRKND